MYRGVETEKIKQKDYEPRNEKPVARMLYIVFENFFRFLWANILCVVFSLPVVTAPAAVSGLHAVISQYYRKGYGDVWSIFIEEFKSDFMQKLFSAVLPAAFCFIVFLLAGGLDSRPVFLMLTAASVALSLSVYGWLFPQLPLLKLSATEGFKNALILSFLEPFRSFGLIAVQAVVLSVMAWFYPFSVPVLFFVFPLLPAVLTELIAFPVIERRLIRE